MTRETTRRGALAALGSLGVAATAGCLGLGFVDRKEKTVTGTIDPGDAAALTADNRLGGLKIRTEDRSDVFYRAKKKSSLQELNFDEIRVDASRDGDRLDVLGHHVEDGTTTKKEPKLSLTLRVPESLPVTGARGDTGMVSVRGTTGDLTAAVDTGDLEVADVDGDVDARADTGQATVTNADGFVGGRVGTGDLEFTDVGGLSDVSAGTGDVTVDAPALRSDTTVSADTGDVTVRVSSALDAELVAVADTGDVSVGDIDAAVERGAPGSRATATLGEGTHEFAVRVGTGDVSIRSL